MHDIFAMQMRLNIHTARNIGIDFEAMLQDSEARLVWIENYRKALSAELAELIRDVEAHGPGTSNGKIEVVDMLHFLVSLTQVLGMTADDVTLEPQLFPPPPFHVCAIGTFLALDDVQNSLKWKWWARGGGFKPDRARRAVLDLWQRLGELCALFEMDFTALKRIYLEKNRVNFQRQDRGYNEDTKTEADNRSIPV